MDILIIEDTDVCAIIAQTFFEQQGHRCHVVDTAEAGMRLWLEFHHPFVLLDIHLPGLSGTDFCQWIGKQPLGKYTFILVSTSDQSPETFQNIASKGIQDYLFKPLNIASLSIRFTLAKPQIEHLQNLKKEDPHYQQNFEATPTAPAKGQPIFLLQSPLEVSVHVPDCPLLEGTPKCVLPEHQPIIVLHALNHTHTILRTTDKEGNPVDITHALNSKEPTNLGSHFAALDHELSERIGIPTLWITKNRPWRQSSSSSPTEQ